MTKTSSSIIKTKVPHTVKNILDKYDINDLLTRTIPKDYSIPSASLEIYKNKTKFNSLTTLEMNETTSEILKNLNNNYPDYKRSEILSYLIENVCDLSKIHTKDISEALQTYYEISSSDPDRHIKILNAYADSLYYQDPITKENGAVIGGLDEESLAYFLISSERTRIIKIKKNQDRVYSYIQSFSFIFNENVK